MNGDVSGKAVAGEHSNQQMVNIIGGEDKIILKKMKKTLDSYWQKALYLGINNE